MMERHSYDIVVVGAGLIGAACALMLAKRTTYSIALIERSKPMSDSSMTNMKVVALGSAATSILDELDVLPELKPDLCHPYTSMFVWDENSEGELFLNAEDYGRDELGKIIDSFECNRCLQRAIHENDRIDAFYGFEAHDLSIEGGDCYIGADDKIIAAQLIVAADGQNSWVRRQAKIFAPSQPFEQQGIVAKIETSLPHENTAWQRFLESGPLAVLPLSNNQSSIVWSADNDYAVSLMGLSNAEFERALAQALQQRIGSVSLASDRLAFPLQSIQAQQYCRQGLVLIGDAAHSIHPLAGQGANLGFKDVRCLVDILATCANESLGDLTVLNKYQRARQTDNQQTDMLMKALHHGFRNNSAFWSTVRGQGMNVLSRNKSLKEFLVNQAMGV
jgi:2-octaprenylphenol hydroxylase